MPQRLATQLILAVALIVLAAKGISFFVNVRTQERQVLHSMTLGADQLSRSITSATWHSMLADHREDAYQVMRTIAEKQGIERIRMFNKDGVLMFSTEENEKLHLDQSAAVCTPCHARATPLVKVDVPSRSRVYRAPDGHRRLAMITPIYNEPSCSEADCHAHPRSVNVLGVLDLTIDASELDQETRALRTRTAVATIGEIGLIGVFLILFTSRFVGKPIRKLIGATKSISAMQLDAPVTIETGGELGELAHSFDSMRERLKEAIEENAQINRSLESKVEQRTAQLRTAQEKLMKSDRLASLGQLAASVAHEINNPVAGVINLSMLMQRILKEEGIPPGRVGEFRRYLGQVATETTRVGRIVSDLLSFSRRSKPQSIDADLNSIVRTTVSLVSHKLSLSNVQVELDLAEPLPAVHCDASQIQQVVMNLVLNGAEAIKGGGVVTVRTMARPESVLLQVSDTGLGMPPDVVAKIFDPFFTTKEEGKGVGLGLAVVYGIVQAHGGEIDVATAIGAGSTFTVTLPLTPASNGAAANGVKA